MGYHFQRGQAMFDLKRYREAVAEYLLELANNPNDFASHCNIAAALVNLGKLREAEKSIRTALSIYPEFPHAHYLLSCVRMNQRRYRQSIRAVKEALKGSHDPNYLCHLAQLHALCGRHLKALPYTAQALDEAPLHVEAMLLRSKLLLQLGRQHEADELVASALAASPADPAAHHAFGTQQLKAGPAAIAYRELSEARRLAPQTINDVDAIAYAQGRLLWPFRKVDKHVARWHHWPNKQRWLLFTALGSFMALGNILLGYSFEGREPSLAWIMLCVLIANMAALPYTMDEIAAATAKLVDPRQFASKYTRFVHFPAIIIWISVVHAFASLVGFVLLPRMEPCLVVFGFCCSFPWFNEGATDAIQFHLAAFAIRMIAIMFVCVIGIIGLGAITQGNAATGLWAIPLFLLLTYYADELNSRISHLR